MKIYGVISVVNTALESITVGVVCYLLKEPLIQIFQSDPQVIEMFTSTFWLGCIGLIITHLQTNMNNGVLVAFGKQRFIKWSMSIACYAIGLPFILASIFLTKLGVLGNLIGYAITDTLTLLAACVRVYQIDIAEEIEEAETRVKEVKEGAIEKSYYRSENPSYDLNEEDTIMGSRNDEEAYNLPLTKNQKADFEETNQVRSVAITFLVAGMAFVTFLGLSLLR